MTINKENKLTDWLPFVGDSVQQINAAWPTLTWGTYGGHHPNKNRAADGMVPGYKTAAGKALGWACAKWIWANRKRLDVWYVIFDGKIISETYPNAGWRTYVPDAAAVKRSRDSAYHYNHVHVSHNASGKIEGLAPVELVPNLPTYYVDPAEVETFLWGVKHSTGEAVKRREPGFPITTGIGFVTVDGAKWLLTDAGYRYHTDYLTTTRPATGGGTPQPEPVLSTYTVKAGDTLTRIAARFGLTDWNVIVDVNPDLNPNKLRIGQVLRLPADAIEIVLEPKPTPKPEEPKPVSHSVKIGGGNVLRETDDMAGRKRWPARKANVVKHLRETGGSVLLLCEVDKSTAADIAEGLGSRWSYYPSHYRSGGEFSPLAILWDDAWDWDGSTIFVKEYSDNQNRFLQRLPLRHKASGKTVYFYASHLENDGDPKTDGHAARRTECREWAKWTLDGPGVFYADLNSTTRSASDSTARQREKPRPILKGAGWKFLTDQSGVKNRELASHHGGLGKTSKGAWIDDMGFKGVAYAGGGLIRTDVTDASDHHFLTLTINL